MSDVRGKTVNFVFSGPGSGVLETHRRMDILNVSDGPPVKMACVPLMPQLRRLSIKEVDYLNLDVEGHELTILNSIAWNELLIRVISIEIPEKHKKAVSTLLHSKGYYLLDSMKPVKGLPGMGLYAGNHFFVHKSVKFGYPR